MPTGDAPTTSEWSTILFSTGVRLILDVLRYISSCYMYLYGSLGLYGLQIFRGNMSFHWSTWCVNATSSLCKACRSWTTQPQAGNRRGGQANEAFAGPTGLAIICETCNWLASCRTCNLDIFMGPQAYMAFKVFTNTVNLERWNINMYNARACRIIHHMYSALKSPNAAIQVVHSCSTNSINHTSWSALLTSVL